MPDIPNSNNPDRAAPGSANRPSRPFAVAVAFAAVFLLAAIPLVLSGNMGGRGGDDQVYFHEPAIRTFAGQLPSPDLRDYSSATTPGYHLVLALVARLVSDHRIALQLAGALFTVALLALLAFAIARRARTNGTAFAFALGLPALCSLYLFVPGVWLQPDNAGWLGVLVILLLALRQPFTHRTAAAAGAALLALAFARQIHVWAAAPIWTAAWLAASPGRTATLSDAVSNPLQRLPRTIIAVTCTLPAFVLILGFALIWGGLTPPGFRGQHNSGFNAATPAFALSLLAIYSAFFGAFLWRPFIDLVRARPLVVVSIVAFGVLLAAIPTTTYLWEQRGSGLWNLVRAMEQRGFVIADRTSPLLLLLTPLGCLALAAWVAAAPPDERWIWLTGVLAFLAAQTTNSNAWQRYLEPFWLLILPLIAASIPLDRPPGAPRPSRTLRRFAIAGPLLLAALLAIITALSIRAALRGVQPPPPTTAASLRMAP